MDISDVLRDLAVVLAIATAAAYLFSRLRLSVVASFLVAGAVLGPTGAGLVAETAVVESLAEIGVVLLLFTVGLEVSLPEFGKMGRQVAGAGAAQVAAAVLCTAGILRLSGVPGPEAFFLGFAVSLSSTAIVLKLYAERGEIDQAHGRLSFGILIFQDLAVIPMMLMIPFLRQWDAARYPEIFAAMTKAGLGVAALLLLARFVIPRLLREVIRLNNREILATTVLLVVLGTAYIAYRWGLSLAMGAFLAGMVISESDYVHEIAAQILPFRDVFNGVFFISVGMLLDLPFLGRHLPVVLPMAVAVVALKALSAGGALRAVGASWRVAALTAIGLTQIGEFSFLLMSEGFRAGLLGGVQFQYLLAVAILTMVSTPALVWAAPGLARSFERIVTRGAPFPETQEEAGIRRAGLSNHVIIAGFGMNGQNLARALRATHLPYAVVDLNESKIRELRAAGEPAFFGDVSKPEILERVGIGRARMLVLAISDPLATRRAVAVARRINPALFLLVRTRYLVDVDDLAALGASAVIPEEFETSVEIFSRVLREYHVPSHVIQQQEEIVRGGAYRILRERGPVSRDVALSGLEGFLRRRVIETFYVDPGSGWEGKAVSETPVWKGRGVLLLAILRGERAVLKPEAGETLRGHDKLVLFGGHAPLASVLSELAVGPTPSG